MPNHSTTSPTRSSFAPPRGFTLVELMIVMIIIGILGSVIMFAMFSAQEAARAAKTKNIISKLNTAITQRYESYIHRRVPLLRGGVTDKAQVFQARRLQAMREMMRMEMPDRHSDIIDDAVTGITRPAISYTYLRRIAAAQNHSEFFTFQGAECLYLIVAHGLEDGEALTYFSQSDIGDFDGDGLPEFLDGWGRPISWLRWPAGFESPRQVLDFQRAYDQFDPFQTQTRLPTGSAPAARNERAYALFPLIYSGGPDRNTDIWADDASTGGNRLSYASNSVKHNPYVVWKYKIGTPIDDDSNGESYGDNIHNHDLSIR